MAAERQCNRDLPRLGQRRERLAPAGRLECAAGDDQGALGRLDPAQQFAQGRGIGLGARMFARDPMRTRHLLLLQVLRYHQHHRPRRAGSRDADRLERGLGELARIGRLEHPFRDGAVHAPVVDFLECLAPQIGARHLAHDQDHRNRILLRGVHGDGRVGRARAAAHQRDAGPAAEPGVGHGHEPCARLMAAGHRVDAGEVAQRIQNAEIAFARNQKHPVDAVILEYG